MHEVLGPGLGVSDLVRLPGGASRETWGFTVSGARATPRRLVLRRDPPGAPVTGVAREAPLLEVASRAGVPVPRVLAASADPQLVGSAFVLMDHVEGETIPRRILRDDELAPARPALATQCGRILATIHSIDREQVEGLEEVDPLEQSRQILDLLGQARPVFELGLRWLAARRPPLERATLVHGDFRNGNLIVGPEGVRAVLDWELAHFGDPLEDLGWLCTRAWRFGADLPVGGFGSYEQLIRAYEAAGGRPVDPGALAWWQAVGTLRWGVLCIVQAQSHLSGVVRSVELAAVGRRVPEQEWDLLDSIEEAEGPGAVAESRPWTPEHGGRSGWVPNSSPTSVELLEAVQEYLEGEVAGASSGRDRFHARVAANVLATVSREISLGDQVERLHSAAMESLGVSDEAELSDAIRRGALDGRLLEVAGVLRVVVGAKLAVDHPGYARPAR